MGGQLIEGKGVSRTNGFAVPAHMLTVIGIDTPHKSMSEHRLYDKRVHLPFDQGGHQGIPDDHPHVLSMKEYGVQQPVLIEVVEVDGKDLYIVVDGRGRVLKQRIADRLLKKEGREGKPVPCIARRANANIEKIDRALGIVLNEHRTEDSILNRAQKAQYLLSTGDTVETVARLFGRSEQTINEWVKLLDMPSFAQDAVETGSVSASAVVKLAGMPKDEMKEALQKLATEGGGAKAATVIAKGSKANGSGSKGQKAGADAPVVAPSKRAIKKAIENGKGVLSEDLILGLRIAIGDAPPTKVKGLVALLRGDEPGAAE
jgi:ParB-like chromosome segregation protein Spo0J